MNKEELMLRKRLIELSNQAYSRDIVTFSDFLNLNELHILHTTPKDMLLTRYERLYLRKKKLQNTLQNIFFVFGIQK